MKSHLFVFVGGLHRSGTSIFFRCLRDHPEVSGFRATGVPEDEGQFLQDVYPAARAHGGPGLFGFSPAQHMTESSDLVSASNRSRLFSRWSSHWDLSKRVLIEKSPPNLLKTRFLQALFPNARFLMITRHPVAVAYATRSWAVGASQLSLERLIEHWLACYETFEQDRAHLRNVCLLRYEDFVADSHAVLNRTYRFLDLDPHEPNVVIERDTNDRYLRQWKCFSANAPTTEQLDAARIKNRFEQRVGHFGYSLDV